MAGLQRKQKSGFFRWWACAGHKKAFRYPLNSGQLQDNRITN